MGAASTQLAGAKPALPLPFGVEAATGKTRNPFLTDNLAGVKSDPNEVKKRGGATLALVPTLDPKDLASAGWGVIFASDIDPKVKQALQPLLDRRQALAKTQARFKIFEGSSGAKAGQSAIDWLDDRGTSLTVVDPDDGEGVPYYLLLVGSPKQIPFEFQFLLDTQWSVGRICFDTVEEYAAYAQAVVEYETAKTLPHKKQAAMWMPHNTGDDATGALLDQVGTPFSKHLGGYSLNSYLGPQATKEQLTNVLSGKMPGGQPAVLFTGSHGLEWSKSDPAGQKKNQGALVTQEWSPGSPVQAAQMFSAADVPADCAVKGLMYFLFACFGGGCPANDTYERAITGEPLALAPEPMLAQLPQKLLAKGALAVMAHVDRAWAWSFQAGNGRPQNQVMRSTIEAVMMGLPAGLAMDYFNSQWTTLAALLGIQAGAMASAGKMEPPELSNLVVARDDARNYVLFGDPFAKLRVNEMGI